MMAAGGDSAFLMNDWSFSQLCEFSGAGEDNRLSPDAASQLEKAVELG